MKDRKSCHHSLDIYVAQKYGVEEALLIHHFQHWIVVNINLKRNFHEGSYWSYQTLDEIAAHFPYISKARIFDLLNKLCTGKSRKSKDMQHEPVLKKGNFNKSSYDRTVWYSFCEPSKWLPDFEEPKESGSPKSILEISKIENVDLQNQDCPSPTPIPYSKNTYLKKDNNNVPPAPKGEHRDANAPDNPVSFSSGDEGEEEEDFEGLILRPQKSNQNLDGYSESTKCSKQPLKPKENSSVGLSLASSLLARILAVHPKLKPPKLESWAREIDLMISIDKREALDIAALIDYIFDQDAFWVNQVRSTDSLRRNFDKIWAKMHPASNRGALIQKNRSIAHEAVSCMKMTETGKTMRITNDYLLNIKTMDQIPFDIDYIEFKARMCASFGLKEY